MESQEIYVRTALMPLFYKDFHCLGAACRDNCCGGWEIAFSKKDYLRIKRAAKSEELKKILSEGMSRLRDQAYGNFYAHFKVGPGGICAFQTEEGLCRLQLECGEEVLPKVCQVYPRRFVYTSAGYELSLSPSCEGVLALLWDLPQGIDFWEEPIPKTDWRTVVAPPQMVRFADVRSFCIDVLQERSLPFARRMLLLGLLIQRLKDSDWTEEGAVDQWLAWGEDQLRSPFIRPVWDSLSSDRVGFLTGNTPILLELYENTAGDEKNIYRDLFSALSAREDWEQDPRNFTIDSDRYRDLEEKLEELLDHSDCFWENLMVLTAFYQTFPLMNDAEKLWRSYVELCVLYSFFRFSAVLGCHQQSSRERLFQVIGTVSRDLLHNARRRERLLDGLFEKGTGTLAHMAILLDG